MLEEIAKLFQENKATRVEKRKAGGFQGFVTYNYSLIVGVDYCIADILVNVLCHH